MRLSVLPREIMYTEIGEASVYPLQFNVCLFIIVEWGIKIKLASTSIGAVFVETNSFRP